MRILLICLFLAACSTIPRIDPPPHKPMPPIVLAVPFGSEVGDGECPREVQGSPAAGMVDPDCRK